MQGRISLANHYWRFWCTKKACLHWVQSQKAYICTLKVPCERSLARELLRLKRPDESNPGTL